MARFVLVSLCCTAFILADSATNTKSRIFELSANSVSTKDNIVIAEENAFLLSEDVYMYADKITYDKEKENVILEGNVRIYRGQSLFVDAKRVDIDMRTKHTVLTPAYFQNENGIWVSSKEIVNTDKAYSFNKAIISGCDIQFPIWHLNTTSGTYDSQREYASAWNSRLYLGSLPIFYLPYFRFPTSTKRSSGLLIPEFGITSRDGFAYMQPLYIAPFNQWDITLTPQHRSNRGNGGNYEFRIADEQNNIAHLRTGYFEQYKQYINTYDLRNRYIFGIEFDYIRLGVLGGLFKNYQDNFYASIIYMNDLEYKRLQRLSNAFNTRLNASRVNYYGQNGNNYLGLYFKYFLDLSQVDNTNTMQTLPNLQLHHYIDTLFFENLYYSLDVQSKNITRQEGYTYWQNSISAPLGLQTSLFKEYLSVNAKLDLFASQISLGNADSVLNPLQSAPIKRQMTYGAANYAIELNSDIAKSYKHFFHTMHLEGIYDEPLYRYTSDALNIQTYNAYSELAKSMSSASLQMYWNPNDVLDMSIAQPKLDLKFSTYFYNTKGRELMFYRIYQRIFTENMELTLKQSLRQELGVNLIDGITLSGNVFYSHNIRMFEEASVAIGFNKFGISSHINYFFKLDSQVLTSGISDPLNAKNSSFLRASLGYDFGYFQFSGNVGYDVENRYFKDWYVILSRDIRCFGVSLKFATDVRPILTTRPDNPIDTITNQYIKVEFRFVPLAGIGFTQRLQSQ